MAEPMYSDRKCPMCGLPVQAANLGTHLCEHTDAEIKALGDGWQKVIEFYHREVDASIIEAEGFSDAQAHLMKQRQMLDDLVRKVQSRELMKEVAEELLDRPISGKTAAAVREVMAEMRMRGKAVKSLYRLTHFKHPNEVLEAEDLDDGYDDEEDDDDE